MNTASIASIALSLFILMDPIGNIPLYIAFLKGIPPKRQREIILRELLIALGIIVLFNFLGNYLLNLLSVSNATVHIAGGIILFLIALKMIFPAKKGNDEKELQGKEPFIVPLAVPFVAGPAVLAVVMLMQPNTSTWVMLPAIFIAWITSTLILLSCSWLQKILKDRGIIACERLMGLILTLIAVEMLLQGIKLFIR